LDYGDPLTARETTEELSVEVSELEEGQTQLQPQDLGESQGAQRKQLSYSMTK